MSNNVNAPPNPPNSVMDVIRKETLSTIRIYFEIVVVLALTYALYTKDKQVTKLQEKLYTDSQEGLQYWREINEKSNDLQEASRALKELEETLRQKEEALRKR